MGAADKIAKEIAKKAKEIDELTAQRDALDVQIRDATNVLYGMKGVLRYLPVNGVTEAKVITLRPGSEVEKVRSILAQSDRPLHIRELLEALSKEHNKANRVSLSGSLSAYARKGQLFSKPAPNTFWLIEKEKQGENE